MSVWPRNSDKFVGTLFDVRDILLFDYSRSTGFVFVLKCQMRVSNGICFGLKRQPAGWTHRRMQKCDCIAESHIVRDVILNLRTELERGKHQERDEPDSSARAAFKHGSVMAADEVEHGIVSEA